MAKAILDVCCGGRMFWFDKQHPDTLFVDNRRVPKHRLTNGSLFGIEPDQIMDFRNLQLPAESFYLIVFDPPHVKWRGPGGLRNMQYGYLEAATWRDDLKRGFAECFRVLKPNGTLIFKWNETDIPTREILKLTSAKPLFGHRSGKASKTHWLCFMKPQVQEEAN